MKSREGCHSSEIPSIPLFRLDCPRKVCSRPPEADRRTLIRRLALDLTGLPPTPSEVEAFDNDKSPAAYEKLVDRLLASHRYAEKQAMLWLDAVRYADTRGFHDHKFDPIKTKDFYSMKAFFADIKETGLLPSIGPNAWGWIRKVCSN